MSTPYSELKLEPRLYAPTKGEVAFFKSQTGIEDEEELKWHILAVQKTAWDVTPYLCIRSFNFLKFMIPGHPKYAQFMKLKDERPGAIFLELACFFGTDVRKAIADGYPMENIVTSDLEPVFWDRGHKLFKSAPETFPVKFMPGDVLDPNHIAPREPFYSPPTTPRPVLKTLTSLTPLQGHVSAIYVGAFFHLFDEETQARAVRAIASLLSPEPGSMIFGYHTSRPDVSSYTNLRGQLVYCHSPETWAGFWNGKVFEKGTVDVWVKAFELMKEVSSKEELEDILGEKDTKMYVLGWCITRL